MSEFYPEGADAAFMLVAEQAEAFAKVTPTYLLRMDRNGLVKDAIVVIVANSGLDHRPACFGHGTGDYLEDDYRSAR